MYFVVQGKVGNCGKDIIVDVEEDMKEGMVGPSYPQRKALEGGHVLSNRGGEPLVFQSLIGLFPFSLYFSRVFNPLSVYFLFPCDAPEEIMYLYD